MSDKTTVRERADEMIAWCRAWPDNVSGLEWALIDEIERLRAALAEVVTATDAGAYFTARRAAGLAIGKSA